MVSLKLSLVGGVGAVGHHPVHMTSTDGDDALKAPAERDPAAASPNGDRWS
jgi:hypothetical protein